MIDQLSKPVAIEEPYHIISNMLIAVSGFESDHESDYEEDLQKTPSRVGLTKSQINRIPKYNESSLPS